MSWDRFDYTEIALCACGNGNIIRHAYTEYDDWNRQRDGITSEEIKCDNCSHKYHIEHHVRYYQCHSWDGDGIVDKTYLVPNGITIPNELSKKDFHFKLDEQIVSQFSLTEISAAKSDMLKNKYSTRLELQISRDIVELFFKEYKRRSLPPIIALLKDIENNYGHYEWTSERLKKYRNNEENQIAERKQAIANIIEKSIELSFRRAKNEQIK